MHKAAILAAACLAATALASCSREADMTNTPGNQASADGWQGPIISAGLPQGMAEQAARIRASGRVIDPASFAIFAPLVAAPPYDDVRITQDLAYGPDPAHRLDLYTPVNADDRGARPVLLYVHGGGFVAGSKQGGYYPQSATAWAVRNAMIGVNIDYRLAPDHPWPAGRDDLAAAIAWVRANIARHGGDPDRIILWGHSAGASHVADYVQHADRHGPEAAGVIGALLLSPVYEESPDEPHPYYGQDDNLRTAAPAIERLASSTIPLMVGWAEYDPPIFDNFARMLGAGACGAAARAAGRQCPRMLFLKDHDHMTEGASIGSGDQSLAQPLLEWIATLEPRTGSRAPG